MSVGNDVQYKEVSTKENNDEPETQSPYGYGVRHVQLLLATLSMTAAFLARSHIGVTVVAMTKPHNNNTVPEYTANATWLLNSTNNKMATTVMEDVDYDNFTSFENDSDVINVTEAYNFTSYEAKNVRSNIMTFDWSKSIHETILGSFFLGYSIMMFPMGMVGQRWGGKLPIQVALLINGLASILTPWLASWGNWKAVCACRILQGLSQAGFVPGIQITVARWSSPNERGRFITYVYTGPTLGTVIAFQLSGVLAASSWGWPSTFWVTGSICLIMFVVVTIFGSVSPAEHKTITEEEKNYIMGKVDHDVKKSRNVPWKAMLTSKYVWATLAAHIGSGLGFIFFFNQVPSYIHYVLNVNVKKSGLLSSLPYASNIVTNFFYGFLSDFLTNRKILSIANARRMFNSFSQCGLAASFLAVSFTKNVELAVICLVLAMSFHAAVHCGWMVNHIDLASNYAGTLMSVTNTITCSMSVLLPLLISYIVTDVTNQFQWRTMFLLMATLSVVTNGIFVCFMSSDSQPWNDLGQKETENEDKIVNNTKEEKA